MAKLRSNRSTPEIEAKFEKLTGVCQFEGAINFPVQVHMDLSTEDHRIIAIYIEGEHGYQLVDGILSPSQLDTIRKDIEERNL